MCKSYVHVVVREHIVVYEDGADLLRDAVVREAVRERSAFDLLHLLRAVAEESAEQRDWNRMLKYLTAAEIVFEYIEPKNN